MILQPACLLISIFNNMLTISHLKSTGMLQSPHHCNLSTTLPWGSVHGERANFAGLVLGCIEADFCNQIFVGKLSPRSTQYPPLHRSPVPIINNLPIFSQNLSNFWQNWNFDKKEWDWRAVQRSILCRSRRELSNESLRKDDTHKSRRVHKF